MIDKHVLRLCFKFR